MRIADFLYDNSKEVKQLLELLGGETNYNELIKNQDDLRIGKVLVAIMILAEEGMCIIEMGVKKQEYKEKLDCYFPVLEFEIKTLDPSIENLIFCEKVSEKRTQMLYFQNYLQKELSNLSFMYDFEKYCQKLNENQEYAA